MDKTLLIVDHELKNDFGHHAEYVRRIASGATRMGYKVVVGANKECNGVSGDFTIDKFFSCGFWDLQVTVIREIKRRFLGIPPVMSEENEEIGRFGYELQTFIKRWKTTREDAVFIPTFGWSEIYSLGWNKHPVPESMKGIKVLLRRELGEHGVVDGVGGVLLSLYINRVFRQSIRNMKAGAVEFFCDTSKLVEYYKGVHDISASLIRPPAPSLEQRTNTNVNDRRRRIGFLGGLREEKGYSSLPGIIRMIELRCKGRVSYLLQCEEEEFQEMIGLDEMLDIEVERADTGVASNVYNEILCSCDVIVLAYNGTSYRSRSSGIFAEAICLGIPVVHPVQLDHDMCLNGLFGFREKCELAEVIETIIENYSNCKKKMEEISIGQMSKHSVDTLCSTLLGQELRSG